METTTSPPARLRGRALLSAVAEGTAGAVGEEFLRCLARNVAEAFAAKLVLIAEADDPSGMHVRALACWYDGAFVEEPIEYDTAGQPCAVITEHPWVSFPEALTERFPDDRPAVELGLESYLAVCLRSSENVHLGHLAVLDARPMEASEEDDEIAAAAYFVAAESLANAARYAQATRVAVRVKPRAGELHVEVHDDGVGGADTGGGTGLAGLADRVEVLHGCLDIDSPPGGGTRVHASIPLAA